MMITMTMMVQSMVIMLLTVVIAMVVPHGLCKYGSDYEHACAFSTKATPTASSS